MANWTEAQLETQWQNAVTSGWIPFFEAAAQKHNVPVELLLGIASRETNMRNIQGDFRNGVCHGYGIMQVDIGTDPEFCSSWSADDVQPSIDCGTQILAGKRDYLLRHGITETRAIAAAYNTGEGNVVNSITHGLDPDHTTTGGDYGRDVMARMQVFVRLRSQPGLGNTAATTAS